MMIKQLTICGILLSQILVSARADEANVRKALDGLLATYSPVGKDTAGFVIDHKYQLKQTSKSTYSTQLKHFTWKGRGSFSGMRVEYGPIDIVAVDKGENVEFSYKLSSPITVHSGKPTVARVRIGHQMAKTTWNTAFGFYTSHKQTMSDVRIYSGRGKKAKHFLRVANIDYSLGGAHQAKLWRIPFSMKLSGLHFMQGRADWLDVGSMNIQGYLDQQDPKKMLSAHREWTTARNQLAPSPWQWKKRGWGYARDAKSPNVDGQAVQLAVNKLFDLFHDGAVNVTLNNISAGNGGATLFSAYQFELGSMYQRNDRAGSDISLYTRVQDYQPHTGQFSNTIKPFATALPHDIYLQFAAKQLPRNLGAHLSQIIVKRANSHPRQRNSIMMKGIYQMLINSPMTLANEGSYVQGKDYRIELDAEGQLKPVAKYGVVGSVTLGILNMKGLQSTLVNAGLDKKMVGKALAIVNLFSNITREEIDGQQQTKATMKFTANKSGKVLMNGKDISLLLKHAKKIGK